MDDLDFDKCPKHSGLETSIKAIKEDIYQQGNLVQKLFDKIEELKDVLNSRPSWAVLAYFTFCTSAVGILITIVLFLLKWK